MFVSWQNICAKFELTTYETMKTMNLPENSDVARRKSSHLDLIYSDVIGILSFDILFTFYEK
jgi:hypothetical protein